MSVTELKQQLVESIQNSEDERWLESVRDYAEAIKNESSEPVYKLSDAQRAAIHKGQEEVRNGNYTSHEEVMREWKDWNNDADSEWTEK